jgi:tetratricopeptide (TPR) repeat protein
LLAAITTAVYWPLGQFEFLNFDDSAYVTANPHVFRGPTVENIVWAFTNLQAANWHPITWLSHMLDCRLFGYNAGFHHLTNLLIHVANALLLFGLLRQLTGAIFRSAIVAALFAWHPLHVESVAWIAERKDVLSTFFGLLALHAYARYAGDGSGKAGVFSVQYSVFRRGKRVWYVAALGLFALSLMSKPMLVTIPFVMLLFDFWPLRRLRGSAIRGLVLEKAPFFLLTALDSIVTSVAQKSGEAIVDTEKLPITARLVNAVMAYAGYLRKMAWPSDLAGYYPYRHDVSSGEVAVALLVLVLVSVLVLRLIQRAPYLVFGWLWYLGMLVPVIGLVQVGGQSMANRYTYLPLTGIFVGLVWGMSDLLTKLRYRAMVAGALSVLILIGCLGATWKEEKYWHDSESLFRRDLQLFPAGNAMANHCLGRALFDRGEDTEARAHFEEVVRLSPGFVPGHLNLANCLSRQGNFMEARVHYEEAIRLKPENPEAYKCLGSALAAQMQLDEARTNFLAAIRYKPDYSEAYMRLGMAEMAEGRVEEALKHLAEAVRIHPDNSEAQYFLAHALADQKRFEEATAHYLAAIKVNPGYAAAMNDVAWMWLTDGEPHHAHLNEAIGQARRACELTQGKNATYLETLGVALSEAGRFAEAIAVTEKSAALAAAEGNRDAVAQTQKHLLLYHAGRSYSEGVEPAATSPR